MLSVANLANPANLICQSICAAIWDNPGSPANPICLLVRVAVLANPAQVMLLHLANPVNAVLVN
jgi:hypothetical protein